MRLRLLAFVSLLCVAVPTAGRAAIIPEAVPDLPLLGAQAYRGNDLIVAQAASVAPTAKTADGDISDWVGTPTRFGGTSIYSRGEYVYQDYVMDDWGADDGQDFARVEITDELAAAEPRTYRAEALAQAAGEQFGAPGPETISATAEYGDAAFPPGLKDQSDIEEVRIAADDTSIHVMVRTTGMTPAGATAVVALLDTSEGGSFPAPGGIQTTAEYAVLAIGTVGSLYEEGILQCSGCVTVATNETGFINAMELSIPRSLVGSPSGAVRMGVATGVSADGSTIAAVRSGDAVSDLINVAFRFDEPARIWMDHDQSLALRAGVIDSFLTAVDLDALEAGRTETFEPRPGYFERVYETDSAVNAEREDGSYYQGSFQHYGVYIPTSYRRGTPAPATWWTHYRGGHAHDAAAWVPGLLRQLGEQRGNIVISPGARGTSTWYVGRGHEDFLDAWDDSMAAFSIDPDRVYLSGYSMGGWASWFLGMVYPDRWAAAFPTAGPPTQGLWAGAGEATGPQNGATDAEAQLTFPLIENARALPYVIYHGTDDELVPVTGVARMAARFDELGYRNRFHLFPGYEHYTAAIIDEWNEAGAYMNSFRRDPNPPRVTYVVKPALEHAAETVQSGGASLDYHFDGAYWVSDLAVRDGAPTAATTLGSIDATTSGRGIPTVVALPEAGTGGQSTPYVMAGTRWQTVGATVPSNSFTATLKNLSTGTLDVARMGLSSGAPITATVTSDGPSVLRLVGSWQSAPVVTGANASFVGGVLEISVASGLASITITP